VFISIYAIHAPWSRVLLVKLTGFQLIKKFPTSYGNRRFINSFNAIYPTHLILPDIVTPIKVGEEYKS